MPRGAKSQRKPAEVEAAPDKPRRSPLPIVGIAVAGTAGVLAKSWAAAPRGGADGLHGGAAGGVPGDGGWSQNATFAAMYEVNCTIPHRDNLTTAEFEAEFLEPGLPVIFRSEEANDAVLRALSQRELRRRWGDVTVSAGQSAAYTRTSTVSETMTFEAFLNAMLALPPPDLYMFETSEFMEQCQARHGSTPMDDYRIPRPIRHSRLHEWVQGIPARLAVGPEGTGTSFHMHGVTFAHVFYGKKRWSIYGPGALRPGGYDPDASHTDWLRDVYPSLAPNERPLECVQNPGEVLYLPDGWEHATLNLGQTVAFAFESPPLPGSGQALFEEARNALMEGGASRKETREAISKLKEAVRFNPTSAHYWNALSNAHAELGEGEASLEAARKAVRWNPKDITQHACLVQAFLDLARVEDAARALRKLDVSRLSEIALDNLVAPAWRLSDMARGTPHEKKVRRLLVGWRKAGFDAVAK